MTTDIADNWEHVDTHVQMQRMAFENAVSCNVGSLIKNVCDLFIRILIREASCCDNIQRAVRLTLMLLIFYIKCIQSHRCSIAACVDAARCINEHDGTINLATN